MADNIVGGLFGMTPELLQAQRNAQLEQQAANFVNNYGDQGAMFGYKLGNVLGRGIGGMLGAQDPEMMRIQQRQQMLQGLDINDPQSLMKAAQAANQRGDTPAAQELYAKANAIAKAQADIAKTQAETQKALREPDPFQRLLEKGDYTAESIKQAQISGDIADLVRVDKTKPVNYGDTAEIESQALFGVPFSSLTQTQAKQVADSLEAKGVKKAAASATKVSSITQQENAFGKTRGESQAKLLDTATASAQGAASALNRLMSMEEKNKTGTLYSGPQANAVLESANFLESIGLLSKEQAGSLTNSTVYSKLAKDLVMQDLGGKLGAQVSDADRQYVEARIPQLTTSPKARTELIQKLKEINQGKIKVYRKMNEHANKYGNLNDFDFSQDYVPFVPKSAINSSSDNELIGKYLNPTAKK